MSAQADDLRHLKRATAILAACIVRTLHESDRTFQGRFLDRLGRAYVARRDDQAANHELELFAWTRELLTGFNRIEGQREPFLGGD